MYLRNILWWLAVLATGGLLAAEPTHWAFRPLASTPIPEKRADDWSKTPIDGFILNKLEPEGLAPQAEADRYTLIRRVTAGLTGLPPSPEEIEAFVSDPSADAYDRLVDDILKRPAFGECWARH